MAFKGAVCGAAAAMLLPAAASSDLITCHTAVEGEECKDTVDWAMSEGIYAHPEWYPGLTPESSFKEFQRAIFDSRRSHSEGLVCSPPCEGDDTCCCVAANGTACYQDIMWALTDGIFGAPENYEGTGLTEDSSYVEFQSYLSTLPTSTCTRPCSGATTTTGDGQSDDDATGANGNVTDANDETTPEGGTLTSGAATSLPVAAASALALRVLLGA